MPLDYSNQSSRDREVISSLVQQADQAWEAQDRATCIDLIEHIYNMLDVRSGPHTLEPRQSADRTVRGVRSVARQY